MQEIVTLNLRNSVVSNKKRVEEWGELLRQAISIIHDNNKEMYILVDHSMFGLYLTVCFRTSLVPRIKSLEKCEVKAGYGGFQGNKGAVCISIKIGD
jgi:hypothetical protein